MAKQKETEKKGGRGFASMDDEKQREIASQGGKGKTTKGDEGETPSSGGRRGNPGNSGTDDRGSRDR